MAEQEPSKYAHFENVEPSNLHDIYERHGEVARDIFQDTLRQFTGNQDLTVDLVRLSPLQPLGTDVIERMAQYDVVSVSTEIGLRGIENRTGIANPEVARLYKQRFEDGDMPVYIALAGNSGESLRGVQQRVADLGRNTLVVGESNNDAQGSYVEEHSSKVNPTMLSDNPFNRGVRYQYYNTSPSLDGHEDLIRQWQISTEVQRQYEAFIAGEGKDLDEVERGKAYLSIYDEYSASEELEAQVKAFMDNPETLHALVMAELRQDRDIDENGFVTGIDGSSFSAPEQAGYVSGAKHEQEQREEQNLPVLTEEEIITLAKMATIDTQRREGQSDLSTLKTNDAGFDFVHGVGHGVFQPEIFRALLDEAYKRIENDPDINRDIVTTVMRGEINNQEDSSTTAMRANLPEGSEIVIDRMRVDMEYTVNGSIPHFVLIKKPDEEATYFTPFQTVSTSGSTSFMSWARIEDEFGETLRADQSWDVSLFDDKDTRIEDMSLTVYGYNKGGLIDQMMDYSKTLIAANEGQKPETTPDIEDAPLGPENSGQDNDSPPGPRR